MFFVFFFLGLKFSASSPAPPSLRPLHLFLLLCTTTQQLHQFTSTPAINNNIKQSQFNSTSINISIHQFTTRFRQARAITTSRVAQFNHSRPAIQHHRCSISSPSSPILRAAKQSPCSPLRSSHGVQLLWTLTNASSFHRCSQPRRSSPVHRLDSPIDPPRLQFRCAHGNSISVHLVMAKL